MELELYKKLLRRIENDEPIYCNKTFAKDLEKIANEHHKVNWIDAKNKPKHGGNVLVSFNGEWVSSIRTASWTGNSWMVHGDKPLLTDEIVLWREIPEPQ
ncbi:MAG: hypothetical protein HRT87_01295 [Legionellales bacterium]|nr:hypothetical protein [Legionellales bacterium]